MIPVSLPNLGDQELKAIKEVLDSGWLAHGEKNMEFERSFAAYLGVREAVSLNSCTSALFLALKALNVQGEVLIPSFTFVATANAVVTAGATPVFVDIDYHTCNMDPAKIETLITSRTQAIIPVHYAGQSCQMDTIMAIADRYNLVVIEDSAETIGGTFKGKKTGSFGIGCFSFFPTKNITTGEGGMLTTHDPVLAARVKALAGHGIEGTTLQREKKEKPWLRAAAFAGYNFRMSNILAAVGVEQLKKLDAMNATRRKHAEYLNMRLNPEFLDLPIEANGCTHVYQMYTVKVRQVDRTRFVLKLREKGIGASVHFDPPVHQQPFYKNLDGSSKNLPVTEKVAASIVTLPLYPQMTREQLDTMITAVEETIWEIGCR
jgi:perosamine synthetase